ncbi:MAG: cation-transporting P-type ATPase [Maribacter sp.]|nr:cation-transporting P-type ATPase [Maribacter sp.]
MNFKPYALTIEDVLQYLNSDPNAGLSDEEAAKRLLRYPYNEIPKNRPKSKGRILFDQFADPIIYILIGATVLAFFLKDWQEGIAILVVILITVLIGFFMELQAVKSLESLRKIGQTNAQVIRSGKNAKIRASELVPGDILLLEVGDIITADARLIQTENLMVKESVLTGESIAVEKSTEVLMATSILTEQKNMVFKGTLVSGGNGKAIATATGVQTELGKIQQMGLNIKEERTPLEKKMAELTRWLIGLTIVLTVLIIITGYLRGNDFILMVEIAVALAVATIPEGLPIVATIALARGMLRLSKKQVIIKNLEAVETLGATNIIFTDKTGTLTEDHLKVHTILTAEKSRSNVYGESNATLEIFDEDPVFHGIILAGILCNDVAPSNTTQHGDAIDMALHEFARFKHYEPTEIQKTYPEKMQLPFNTNRKMMATVHQVNDGFITYAKGAFESIITHCGSLSEEDVVLVHGHKEQWVKRVNELASKGLRTLAFAYKKSKKPPNVEDFLTGLTFMGVVGFMDPAREDVKPIIKVYNKAGIKVVMLTGDHPGTAQKIAEEVGILMPNTPGKKVLRGENLGNLDIVDRKMAKQILDTTVFARVVPEQKLKLVAFYQKHHNIVGMIGDGINDVPAIQKADIGIAMGIRGTEAAREAADMILKNDKFTAIELAIRQGRIIYQNIRQFVVYLLSSNLAEIISVGFAALLNLPSPLLPLQILFLNLVTDIFPALALGLGKGEEGIMGMPPRKSDEPIMTRIHWYDTVTYGLSISAAVLGITGYSYFILKLSPSTINNLAFYTLILAQLLNVFNIPKRTASFFRNEVTTNGWVWAALVLCTVLTLGAASVKPIAEALSLVHLSLHEYGLILLFAFGSLLVAQFVKRASGFFVLRPNGII